MITHNRMSIITGRSVTGSIPLDVSLSQMHKSFIYERFSTDVLLVASSWEPSLVDGPRQSEE